MTKRGMLLGLAVLLVAALGATTTAEASSRLTLKEAKRIARKLERKQMRKYDLRANHVRHPTRVSRRRIDFAYDARTEANTYCTAPLRVRKRVRGSHILYSARIGRQDCAPVPDDALAVERATNRARRGLRVAATRRSVRRYGRDLDRCEDLRVPRRRRAAARLIEQVAAINAIVRPNAEVLQRFVLDLFDVDTSRLVIERGADAWADVLDAVDSLPKITRPCRALHRWKRDDWAAAESPIDPGEVRRALRRLRRTERPIMRTERFLRRVGVYPSTARAFDPDGLLLSL